MLIVYTHRIRMFGKQPLCRCRCATLIAVLVSVYGTTNLILLRYQPVATSNSEVQVSRPQPVSRQVTPLLQQELTKRCLQKLVEEFWIYLKTEIESYTHNTSLKNNTSGEQLTKLIERIDQISYRRWMHVPDLKNMCLKSKATWQNMRSELLNVEKTSGLTSIGLLVKNADDFPRLIDKELVHLSHYVEAPRDWKRRESLALGAKIHKDMHSLQNPHNCSNIKKLLCDFIEICGTGFGCQAHHVSACLLVAYATNRTLIFSPGHWIYTSDWTSVFLPFTSKCTATDRSQSRANLGDFDWEKKHVVKMQHLGYTKNKPKFLPPALPAHLTDKMLRFHGSPHVWWVGQFLSYAMRGQPEFNQLVEDTLRDLNFTHPIVGIHVRRTDKIKSESQLHPVEEYMHHVTSWYEHYERWNPRTDRKVFVATDEPSVLTSLEKKYPGYMFIHDSSRSRAAAVNNRKTEANFKGITLDITLLSMTDFLVCTFSSNVGRAAYALMQTRHGDASHSAVSLDDVFYYSGQNPYTVTTIANHIQAKPEENLSINETISRAIKRQNGFLSGTLSSGQKGIFPTFKTVDLISRVNFPEY